MNHLSIPIGFNTIIQWDFQMNDNLFIILLLHFEISYSF